ncbi:MAG: RHS repeat-associated core domain-containing protein, partial [Betaproteobacteria bacterium]
QHVYDPVGRTLYTGDGGRRQVESINRVITTTAGTGFSGYSGEGGPANAARIESPDGIAVGADGRLYIAATGNHRIRRVGPALPGFSFSDILLPSEDGREVHAFNSSGRHLTTLDALTGTPRYQFGHDSSGYLTSITDGSGNVTTIERTSATPTAIVAPGGQRTTLNVSAGGWLLGATNPASEAHTMGYSADGLLQTFTDPRGNIHGFTYDALGRLITDANPAGGSITLSRTEQSNGYTVTTTSALGRVRAYQVEQLSTGAVRRSVTQPSGAKTVTLIDTDSSTQTIYPDGGSSTVQYGPDPRWGMLAPVATSMTLTTPGGLTRTITTTRTATLANLNNLFSLTTLTDTVTDNGAVSTHVYDGATRWFTSTTAAGRSGTLSLDAQGRITQGQIAALAPVGYVYAGNGLLSAITEGSGATSRATSLVYNGARDLSGVSDALGRTVNFAYDAAGRLVVKTLPDGRTIQHSYDAAGNATAITAPGRPAHGFAHTPDNLLSSYTAPDVGIGNTATQYTYGADRALTRKARPDGQLVDITYDAAGRIDTLGFARGLLNYTYSATTARLTGITAPGGIGLGYSRDGALLTGVTWTGPVSGAIAYTYNNDFRVAAEDVNGAGSVSFTYAADGLLTAAGSLALTRNAQNGLLAATALGGVTDNVSYNDIAESTDYSVAYGGSGIYSSGYTRDAIGRITQKTETVDGITATYGYAYDTAGRLTGVTANGITTATYAYDSNGNRTARTGPNGPQSATYDNQDRLLIYGSATYSHTASGELLSKTAGGQTTGYQYDALGNLMAVSLPGGTAVDYLIDGTNRRIGKKVNGVLVQAFLYQGALRPVAELDAAGNVVSRFVYATRGNVPAFMIKSGVTYRIVSDHLGSPRLVIDVATGTVAQRMDYDEFGNVSADTSPGFQPFGFAGGLYDRDTKLVRFGARDYDAETGRWTAMDPILFSGADTNLYAYVRSNPVNAIDPGGLAGGWLEGAWGWVKGGAEFFYDWASNVWDPIPLLPMDAIPVSESDAQRQREAIEGVEQFCKMQHANAFIASNLDEYQRIKGLTSAEHLREFHPSADATPTPSPSPFPKSTPVPWSPGSPEVERILRDSGGVGR